MAHETSKEARAVRRSGRVLRRPLRDSPQGSTEGPRPATSRPLLRPFIREGPHGPSAPRDEATATTSGAILRTRRTDPWCSGPTCQPVTLEIAGSNPVGSAIHPASTYAPSARPDGASLYSVPAVNGCRVWTTLAALAAPLRAHALKCARLRCSQPPCQPRPAATNAVARSRRGGRLSRLDDAGRVAAALRAHGPEARSLAVLAGAFPASPSRDECNRCFARGAARRRRRRATPTGIIPAREAPSPRHRPGVACRHRRDLRRARRRVARRLAVAEQRPGRPAAEPLAGGVARDLGAALSRAADRPADRDPAPARRGPDRPGHPVPHDRRADHEQGGRRGPRRDEQDLRRARARRRGRRRDPRRARRRAAGRRRPAPRPRPGRGDARHGPREEPQAPRVPPRRPGRPRRPRPRLGRPRRSSAKVT